MQDLHAKMLSRNLTAALAITGQRYLNKSTEKTKTSRKKIYQINFSQAFAKMKYYQRKVWHFHDTALGQYLTDLVLLLTQYKEQVRPGRAFPRKLSKFNKRRYWIH